MPRAATRVASTSFAVASSSRPRGSSLDLLPSGKVSSALDMFPSPRPSKMLSSSSAKNRSSSSSPSRRTHITAEEPRTPPGQKVSKRKRVLEDKDEIEVAANKVIKMPERQINTFLANYDLEAENRIRMANQALQVSIESARAQMIASISAFPRTILSMRLEEYFSPQNDSNNNKDKKRLSTQIAGPAKANKTPRAAKPGEIVYSARGSPIVLKGTKAAIAVKQLSSEDEEEADGGGEEPFFDTASDKSESSESFSLPDEAAYTAQVMEQERNRIMSSEGYFPRSSSMFHRTSSST